MDDGSQRELVERAGRGSESAFAMLVQQHERTSLAIAYAVIGDASLAGDVTQEAFLRAWQRMSELEDPDRFSAWLARIVRNLAMDQLRRNRRTRTQEIGDAILIANPAEVLEQDDRRGQINQALAGLDELTRSAVVLKYYEGLSSKQIGDLLELSPAAVDMRLSRGRELLREKLASIAKA